MGAGRVGNRVYRPVLGNQHIEARRNGGQVSEVDLVDGASSAAADDVGRDRFCRFFIASIRDRDRGALARKAARDGASDSAATADYERDSVREVNHWPAPGAGTS